MLTHVKKHLLITAGILSIGCAIAGIFLPILPTTPFLLLAAACFFRSSPKLYTWLIHHKIFGSYIRAYREHHAISLKTKICSIALLWATLAISILFVVHVLWVQILLGAVGIGVTIHLANMRRLTKKMLIALNESL